MTPQEETFRAGQLKLLAQSPVLKSASHSLLRCLLRNPGAKTLSLPQGPPETFANFFLNCIIRRNGRPVLDLTKLRLTLGGAFDLWLDILRETSGFTPPETGHPGEELYHRLRFAVPGIDWQEFRPELSRRDAPDYSLLLDAWKTAQYLMDAPEPAAPAEISAGLFRDSKRLKNTQLLSWSCRLLRQLTGSQLPDGLLLEHYGMTSNPTASTAAVFGPVIYHSRGQDLDWIKTLFGMGQSAMLSWDNLKDIDRLESEFPVLTIENESVFNRIMKQNPDFTLVYTAGFPGKAVRKLIACLSPDTVLRHWGDSDPEGYEIAAVLHRIHPLSLYRCTSEDLEAHKSFCQPLPENKRRRAVKLLEKPVFPFRREIEWLLRSGLWLEQENFTLSAPPASG